MRVGVLFGKGQPQLQDMWVCLLEAFQGSQEALLDTGHVLFREVRVVFCGGVWAWPQQGHEAGCHHVRAELYCDEAWEKVGPGQFRGASLCWGCRVTVYAQCSAGIC